MPVATRTVAEAVSSAPLERHADQTVLGQQFHDTLGAPGGFRHEDLHVLPFPAPLHFGYPVAEPAAELHRRLAGHVPVASVFRIRRRDIVNLQCVERGGTGKPGGRLLVVHLQRGGARSRIVAGDGILVAHAYLLHRVPQAIRRLRRLRDDETSAGAPHVVVEGRRAVCRRLVLRRVAVAHSTIEPIRQRADRYVVERGPRSVASRNRSGGATRCCRRRIPPGSGKLRRAGKHVDDAAAPAELAVSLNRVATGKNRHPRAGRPGR